MYENEGQTISANDLLQESIAHGLKKRIGSMKKTFLAHGINDIDTLFPDAKFTSATPQFIARRSEWVSKVLGGVKRTPFSRIKSIFADITGDDARALGYVKGDFKKEENFTLLKRSTSPQTIYKKQKFDRDDIVDITDFDVLSWVRAEMRTMLDEEIARAILIGDGRSASSPNKVRPDCVRPIARDDTLFTTYCATGYPFYDGDSNWSNQVIEALLKNRDEYRGSGTPTLFVSEGLLSLWLLTKKDQMSFEYLYKSVDDLAKVLRVKEIVTTPILRMPKKDPVSGQKLDPEYWEDDANYRTGTDEHGSPFRAFTIAIMVNLDDYAVGADKGGEVNSFSDFDLDYNQQKFLLETRISGALIRPKSALVVEQYGGMG